MPASSTLTVSLLLLAVTSVHSAGPRMARSRVRRSVVGVGKGAVVDACYGETAQFNIPLPSLQPGVLVIFGPRYSTKVAQAIQDFNYTSYAASRVTPSTQGPVGDWMNFTLSRVSYSDSGTYRCFWRAPHGSMESITRCGQSLLIGTCITLPLDG